MANKQKVSFKKVTSLFMSAVIAASLVQVTSLGAAAETEEEISSFEDLNADNMNIVSNQNAYKSYIEKNAGAAKPMEEVTIDVTKFEASDGAVCEIVPFEGETDCLSWLDSEGSVTWEFDVKTAGLYNLEMFYYPVSGSNTTIEVGLLLDGELPFDEVQLVELDRYWRNSGNIEFDAQRKNQKRPPQTEYDCWVTYPIKDKSGLINDPFSFYLSAGKHKLTLNGVKTNFYMKNIRFYNTEALPTYADIKPSAEEIENTPALLNNEAILIEAETPTYTTGST
ncbi:MAG: hypothetical protein K2G32_01245, partial [Oscillospiraceae bacterium]|nr:hypothetical protein [Oscillospiraceae bacterium]